MHMSFRNYPYAPTYTLHWTATWCGTSDVRHILIYTQLLGGNSDRSGGRNLRVVSQTLDTTQHLWHNEDIIWGLPEGELQTTGSG